MKVIKADEWNSSFHWYYISEGEYSAEQFCEDVIIPALKIDKEPFIIDFSDFKIGISTQMIWIVGYYLFKKGFSVKEIKDRITIVDHNFKDTHNEFILSIVDAERELAKKTLFVK